MYRIRFHGRGGQGMKTASRMLGTAFFLQGYEVQDAPRYGAERRGAPIFAYVRAAKSPVNERGIISHPDLVIVADDTLMGIPAAGVLQGIDKHTILLINTHEQPTTWQQRLNTETMILVLPAGEEIEDRAELPYVSSRCAAAGAALTGVIPKQAIAEAIQQELAGLSDKVIKKNIDNALSAYAVMQEHAGIVKESEPLSATQYTHPNWVDVPFEIAEKSAPAIHAGATSIEVRTGLWRTMRPIINYDKCSGCWWVCSTYCPDGAIDVKDNKPVIDYDHCKGCLVCVAQCPPHAIESITEHEAQQQELAGAEA
ncbi:MAG: 2-oxoacid:acceptor oxidoreductase family protein [Thioalkalispiraceae bacterium]